MDTRKEGLRELVRAVAAAVAVIVISKLLWSTLLPALIILRPECLCRK